MLRKQYCPATTSSDQKILIFVKLAVFVNKRNPIQEIIVVAFSSAQEWNSSYNWECTRMEFILQLGWSSDFRITQSVRVAKN